LSPARRLLASAAAAACVVTSAAAARANPLDVFGFGSRETAMGGAAAANVTGVPATYYNPAGVADAKGLSIQLGYFRASHALAIDGVDNEVDPVKGFNGGLVVPGRLLDVPFGFGLGLHLPDDRISRVRALRQEQPRWELYDNRNQRLYLAANLALRPVRWLAVGAGYSFMSSTRGRLDITGSANIFAVSQSQVRHEVDADLTAIRYPQAGVRVDLSDRVRLAAVYRDEFQLRLDLAARLRGDISKLTTALYELETHSVNNFLPRQVVGAGSWDVTDRVTANLDLTWVQWSSFVAPVAELDVNLDIPPPPGGWPANITPPTTPAPIKTEPLRMRDRVVPHLGVEVAALRGPRVDAFARAGYEWAKSPFAAQTGRANYVDADRHTMSLGAGVVVRPGVPELPPEIHLDGHAQLSVLPGRMMAKDSPADLVGDYRAGGHVWNVGTTLTLSWDVAIGRGAASASAGRAR